MIDWVSPPCGDAAAQSNQAVRLALRGWQRLTADRRELAAMVPHRVSAAVRGPGLGRRGHGAGRQGKR
jgi:hypothetical protein